MLSRFLSQLSLSIINLERHFYILLRGTVEFHPPTEESLDILSIDSYITSPLISNPQLDSVLWAVPKKRISVEKRLNRKFGWPHQVWKPLVPKKTLLTCKSCGDHYEAGCLCPMCYSKVKAETQEVQKVIEKDIGLNPYDKDVMILYEGEKGCEQVFEGKFIIEMTKKRPKWFSRNLLEKTSKGLATTLNVKPSDLA